MGDIGKLAHTVENLFIMSAKNTQVYLFIYRAAALIENDK
jgi:hypothetical protein